MAASLPKAIIEAGYLCDNAKSLADLIFGKVNRWGKLAYTMYSEDYTLRELPIPTAKECGCDGSVAAYKTCTSCSIGYLNMSMRRDLSSKEVTNPGRSYKYYSGSNVLYPFSHGLSYTTFALQWEAPERTSVVLGAADDEAGATGHTVVLTNTGHRTGDEVVFAFFSRTFTSSLPFACHVLIGQL